MIGVLEEDSAPVGIGRAEVVFLVRVVGVTKIVVDLDRLDDPRYCLLAERRHAGRYDCQAADQSLTQFVVAGLAPRRMRSM